MSSDKNIIEEEKGYQLKIIFFFIASICIGTGIYESIPLNSAFRQSFHIGQEQVVLIGSVFTLFYAVGFLVFGWLANYLESKRLLISGTCLLMAATILIGFADSYKLMIVFRGFQGLFAASFSPLAFSMIVKTFPESKRVSGISAVTTGFVMAGILGQLYGSTVISRYSWPVVFWLQAVVYFMITCFMIFIIPKGSKASGKSTSFLGELKNLLRSRKLLACYLITSTLLFSFVGMYTIMGMFLRKSLGVNSEQMLLIRGIGMIGMIGSMFFGKLSKKLGIGNILAIGLLCASLGVFGIGISKNLVLSIVMSVFFVFGITVSLPMVVASIGILAGAQSGNAITLYTFILFIGATAGPIVCNHIMASGNYFLSFLCLAAILGLSFVISLLIKKHVMA